MFEEFDKLDEDLLDSDPFGIYLSIIKRVFCI
jgi:hypothetical protein